MSTTNEKRPSGRDSGAEPSPGTRSPLRRSYESDDFFVGRFLLERCGTLDDVEALTEEELPGEPFNWESVAQQDRARIVSVLELLESVCRNHLDDEYLTVLRRLLAFAAAHPEKPLRARTEPERLAAALAWIALVGNVDTRISGRDGSEVVWWWFGVTSCKRLARSLATTLGLRPEPRFGRPVGWDEDRGVYFKNVDLLHSRCRQWLISQRAQLIANILEREERQRLARPVVHDGSNAEMRAVEADFAMALKIEQDGGRQIVMLGLGQSSADPDHLFALAVPEAYRLLAGLQRALDSVAAHGAKAPDRAMGTRW